MKVVNHVVDAVCGKGVEGACKSVIGASAVSSDIARLNPLQIGGLEVSSGASKSGGALSLYRLALVFDKPSSELTPEDFSFLTLGLREFDAFHFGKITNKTFSELTLQDFIFLRRILGLPSLRVHHSVVGRMSEYVSDLKLGQYKLIDLFCLLSAQCTADGNGTT